MLLMDHRGHAVPCVVRRSGGVKGLLVVRAVRGPCRASVYRLSRQPVLARP
jgi:hypothetical protein